MNTWPGWPKARLGRSRRVRDTAPRAPSTSSRHASCSRARPRKNEQLTRLPGVASLGLGLSASSNRPVAPRAQWHAHAGNGLRRLGAPHLVALPGRHRSRVAREAQQPHERQRLPVLREPSCVGHEQPATLLPVDRCGVAPRPQRPTRAAGRRGHFVSRLLVAMRFAVGAQWRATVRDRTRAADHLPVLHSLAGCLPEDSLAHQHPALAGRWDDAGNDELSPRDVTAGSSRAVFWRCSANSEHRWRATISNRVRHATGCPYCAGRRLAHCA